MASMKLENTRPVGRDVEPFTFMREGTHMNTEIPIEGKNKRRMVEKSR